MPNSIATGCTKVDSAQIEDLDVANCITELASALTAFQSQKNRTQYEIVGIQTGGSWIANALAKALTHPNDLGSLNISFYRDDFTVKGLHPHVSPSNLPFEVNDAHIVLVDDVIMSGRTIRAALNEIFDFGRPKSVTLVTLIDLVANDLPIRPDICALRLTLEDQQRVKLTGPSPMKLAVRTINE